MITPSLTPAIPQIARPGAAQVVEELADIFESLAARPAFTLLAVDRFLTALADHGPQTRSDAGSRPRAPEITYPAPVLSGEDVFIGLFSPREFAQQQLYRRVHGDFARLAAFGFVPVQANRFVHNVDLPTLQVDEFALAPGVGGSHFEECSKPQF